VLCFAGFELDQERARLRGPDGEAIKLRPKSFDMLQLFATNAGHVLSKQDLIEAIWPKVHVGDDSLFQCIREIRTALGDEERQLIKLVSGRGYLFEAEVSVEQGGASPRLEAAHALGSTGAELAAPAGVVAVGPAVVAVVSVVVVVGAVVVTVVSVPPTVSGSIDGALSALAPVETKPAPSAAPRAMTAADEPTSRRMRPFRTTSSTATTCSGWSATGVVAATAASGSGAQIGSSTGTARKLRAAASSVVQS